ncbi:MAG: cyclic nucleotide-binding domain-containing protein [Vicinamibacteria bacterium]|nr:cyclic nucleotide-binding domain-containing protein [Vicinamibacteria bacterium]
MQVKKLMKGDVLWAHGELATTIAFVDDGRLGIKTEDGLISIVGPAGVIGESALLAEAGEPPQRRAAVIALQPSIVTEYPVSFVQESVGAGLPRRILRTLIGQTITNACFVLAAHPDVPLITKSMSALIHNLAESKSMVGNVRSWEAFSTDFAYLFSLRDAVGDVRTRMVPIAFFVTRSEALLEASANLKRLVGDPEIAKFLDSFIAVEKERIEAVEFV